MSARSSSPGLAVGLLDLVPYTDVTSEQSVVTFSVYDRALSEQPFLGTVQIKPALVHDHTVDQWYK